MTLFAVCPTDHSANTPRCDKEQSLFTRLSAAKLLCDCKISDHLIGPLGIVAFCSLLGTLLTLLWLAAASNASLSSDAIALSLAHKAVAGSHVMANFNEIGLANSPLYFAFSTTRRAYVSPSLGTILLSCSYIAPTLDNHGCA